MALSGQQFRAIEAALLDGYDSAFELRRMVRFGLEENLDSIAGGTSLTEQAFNLIAWADRSGRVDDLVRCAAEANPDNAELKALHDAWIAPPPANPGPAYPELQPDSPHVFLSYSRADAAIMEKVRAGLLDQDIRVWTDEGLEPGTTNWQAAIEAALRAADCLVVLLSPEAKGSAWVNIEITVAMRLGRRIFPVLVRGDEDNAVPISLTTVQYVDARRGYGTATARRLNVAVARHVGTKLGTTVSVGPKAKSRASPVSASSKEDRPSPSIVVPSQSPAAEKQTPIVFDWVTIPAGEFLMGSDSSHDSMAFDNEKPQHSLYLPEYRMAKISVTNEQYRQFVVATDHRTPRHWSDGQIPGGKEDHPVVRVSWDDAIAFCGWAGVALPSEAQWEKAARGEQGKIWPWGDEPPDRNRCNFELNVGDTTPVGRYPDGISPYGLLDMAGNVLVWTCGLFFDASAKQPNAYPYRADDGRDDLMVSGSRVVRGGAFDLPLGSERCACRDANPQGYRYNNLGFRVVAPDA